MAKKTKKIESVTDETSDYGVPKAELAKKYARMYKVLKGAKPVPLSNGQMVPPGKKFRAIDALCFPTQLDTLIQRGLVEAVENE